MKPAAPTILDSLDAELAAESERRGIPVEVLRRAGIEEARLLAQYRFEFATKAQQIRARQQYAHLLRSLNYEPDEIVHALVDKFDISERQARRDVK